MLQDAARQADISYKFLHAGNQEELAAPRHIEPMILMFQLVLKRADEIRSTLIFNKAKPKTANVSSKLKDNKKLDVAVTTFGSHQNPQEMIFSPKTLLKSA